MERAKRKRTVVVDQEGALMAAEVGNAICGLLDSEATSHTLKDLYLISKVAEASRKRIVIANNDTVVANGAGPAQFSFWYAYSSSAKSTACTRPRQ